MSTTPPPAPFQVSQLSVATRLSDVHHERYLGYLNEELTRYPEAVQKLLPNFEIFDEAKSGTQIGAHYFPESDTAVLTPRPDFRGNVHRCAAAAFFRKRPEAAEQLSGIWNTTATSTEETALLYGIDTLNEPGQMAAMVAATVMNRDTLARLAATDPALNTRWTACKQFLGDLVGAGFPWPNVIPAPNYSYLISTTGDYPSWTLAPGGLIISAAPTDLPDGYTIDPLATRDAESLPRLAVLDLWPLPEFVLRETLTRIDYVKDVRRSDCDIAGFASATPGQGGRIVIEMTERRTILCHELGHALHFRFHDLFPENQWKEVAAGRYQMGALTYIKSGANEPDYSPRLLEQGFISGYSTSEFAEDVAEIAGALFSGDLRLWAAMPDFGLLARKVALMIDFLHQIDPVFTKRYFDELQQQRVREELRWAS